MYNNNKVYLWLFMDICGMRFMFHSSYDNVKILTLHGYQICHGSPITWKENKRWYLFNLLFQFQQTKSVQKKPSQCISIGQALNYVITKCVFKFFLKIRVVHLSLVWFLTKLQRVHHFPSVNNLLNEKLQKYKMYLF